MISVRLDPAVFTAGGVFENVLRSRAVLNIGSGRDEQYAGKISPAYSNLHPSWRGCQWILLIDAVGSQISDVTFEAYMKDTEMRRAYGDQVLDFAARNLIIVEQNGVPLTIAQMRVFVAP